MGEETVEPRADVRRRFGAGGDELSAEADGYPARAAQFSVRSMNFGQHWRTLGVRDVSYTITLPLSFVLHLLARELPAYTEDCIASPDEEPLEVALRGRQWPTSEQVLDDPELCPLALNWFAYDCLLEWLGDGEPDFTPGYVVNTVDQAERQGHAVRFSGSARATGQPVRYQDV